MVIHGLSRAAVRSIGIRRSERQFFDGDADQFKVLSKVSLGDGGGSRGSIAAVDGMIIVRTGDKVWAFGGKK